MKTTPKTTFLKDLEKIREAQDAACSTPLPLPTDMDCIVVNPSLQAVSTAWRGLSGHREGAPDNGKTPEPGDELVLLWLSPHDFLLHTESACPADLIALKIIVDERDPLDAAREAGVPVAAVDNAIRLAVSRGILLSPSTRIRRSPSFAARAGEELPAAGIFTLQWHITQDCDLDCLHCYDRSTRHSVSLAEGLRILDQMRDFCRNHFVRGQVSFSGGNPLLHPEFLSLYRAAAERGLATAILGNPASSRQLSEIATIQMPAYFQVSLEGLEAHNDRMRGQGHFRRTLEFLDMMKELGVPSEVMLTLTRENLHEVIPLGEVLRNRTGAFSFNRLALFGSGAALALPDREEYAAFLGDYLAAMGGNPVLCLKDNLFNVVLEKENRELFGGCAGYGCGAAFNFLALLPDGEVHACRKFPSAIGSIVHETLTTLYHSEIASSYREGSSSCMGCRLRPACRGCPAVTAGLGGDPLLDRDPFCFRDSIPSK
jgi:selenobiotic family peptide radical SAM maturase